MSAAAETRARRVSWIIVFVEFVCLGSVMQVLLGGSLQGGIAGLITHAPAVWLLAAVVALVTADHVHRRVRKHLSSKSGIDPPTP